MIESFLDDEDVLRFTLIPVPVSDGFAEAGFAGTRRAGRRARGRRLRSSTAKANRPEW
jgi:hypothetical protein